MSSRKIELTANETTTLLRELSYNKSEGGELSVKYDESDNENYIPVISPESKSDKDTEISYSRNQNESITCNGSHGKECSSGKQPVD